MTFQVGLAMTATAPADASETKTYESLKATPVASGIWGTTASTLLLVVLMTTRLLSGLWATYAKCAPGSTTTTSPWPPTPGSAMVFWVVMLTFGAAAWVVGAVGVAQLTVR